MSPLGSSSAFARLSVHAVHLGEASVDAHPVYPFRRDKEGRMWAQVNEHLSWLRRACSEGRTRYSELWQSALSDLRRTMKAQIEEKRRPSLVACSKQASLRAELELDEADEEERGKGDTPRKMPRLAQP